MRKIAVFVEGQTEMILLRRLLEELAGKKNIVFEVKNFVSDRYAELAAAPPDGDGLGYYALLFDCRGETNVKTTIRDRLQSLREAGYAYVVGLRDLYPMKIDELPRLRLGVSQGIPPMPFPVEIVIAVHEVEAWFLQEATHYERISPELHPDRFSPVIGFDPRSNRAEDVYHAAGLLDTIYRIAGRAYKKRCASVQRTVDALDPERLCIDVPILSPSFGRLLQILDAYLS